MSYYDYDDMYAEVHSMRARLAIVERQLADLHRMVSKELANGEPQRT